MGTNRTPTNIRGFITPYEFTTKHIWQAQTTATQGTARAGIPTEVNKSGLVLGARGLQTDAVDVVTLDGGHVTQGAKFGWKYATDADYYGHNMPNVVTDITAIDTLNLVGQKYIVRDAVTLADGVVLVAVEYTTATTNTIRVYAIDTEGVVTFTNIAGVNNSTLGGDLRHPCLCVLDNGNVLCLFYAIDTATDTANVTVYESTDNGGAWDLISTRALISEIDLSTVSELRKITAAASKTQILLFIETALTTGTNKNKGYQYASISDGTKFDLVGVTPTNSTTYRMHEIDVVQHNGVFIVSFIRNNDQIGVTQITDAYNNIFNALVFANIATIDGDFVASASADLLSDGNKSMHMDTDGRIYLYARLLTNNLVGVAYSDTAGQSAVDYGRDWKLIKNPTDTNNLRFAKVIDCGAVGDVANITTASYNGQQIMFNNWLPNGTNAYQHSVVMIRLGMWATQLYPAFVEYPTDQDRTYTTLDWMPADLPTQGGEWVKTALGSPSETLTGARLRIATASGGVESLQYRHAVGDKSNGCIVHAKLDEITGGTATAGTYIGVQMQNVSSATTGYHVRVYITPTALYLYDELGSAQLDAVTGLDVGERALFLHLDNSNGDVTVYYTTKQGPRQYATLTGRARLDSQTANNYIWGASGTTAGTQSDWAYFSYSEGDEMGTGVNSTLNGKQYPALGYYAALDAGLYITTQDGPARQTDQWEIQPQYDYPIDRILYPVSPTRGNEWRSDAVADADVNPVPQNDIAIALDADNPSTLAYPRNGALGLHLAGINFRYFFIQLYNGTTWATHCAVQNQVGPQFNYTRAGNTIRCTQTLINSVFLHYGECTDWYLYLYDDEDELLVRKVVHNTEGVINNTTTTKTVTFTIEDPAGIPATGYAKLVPNACTAILHNVTGLSALRIRIANEKTNEGYHKMGHMVFGPVVLPATQYGRGRTINFEANTETNEAQNGVLHTRVNGRGGRTVRIAWADGVDVTELYNTDPTPDYYITKSGGTPAAAIGSAPTTMYGIVQQMQGNHNALVYLPTVPTDATTPCTLINRYHDHVMVTLGNDVQIENVIGDESKNEVLRVGTVVMREVR